MAIRPSRKYDLGDGGLIGGTGEPHSRRRHHRSCGFAPRTSTINAAQNFSGTLLSAGPANIAAGGTVSGTIVRPLAAFRLQPEQSRQRCSPKMSRSAVANRSPLSAIRRTRRARARPLLKQANSYAQQQVSSDNKDDDKKKSAKRPTITRRVGRVTVILPKSLLSEKLIPEKGVSCFGVGVVPPISRRSFSRIALVWVRASPGYIDPPLERLHGYNIGKYEAKLRSDRLHYRLQSGYGSGYIRRVKFGGHLQNRPGRSALD